MPRVTPRSSHHAVTGLVTLLVAIAIGPLTPSAQAQRISQSLSLGTHLRFAQPMVTFGLGGVGHVDFNAAGAGEPGVEAAYGRYGVSVSGAFLKDPADNLWNTGLGAGQGVRDIRTRYHGSEWGVEAHYVSANGFHWDGRVYDQSVNGYRPDVVMNATGVTLYRAFDPDSRVYRLSEGLSETGGNVDVFFTAGASRASLRGDHALLPLMASPDSRFYEIHNASVTSASIGGGFAITSNLHGLYFDQSLFGGYGPQVRTWGDRSDVTWNLAKVNLRVGLGLRTRWFDVGVGVEDEAYASLAGADRMVVHALAAQAKVGVVW
jgi:hypothetical protein